MTWIDFIKKLDEIDGFKTMSYEWFIFKITYSRLGKNTNLWEFSQNEYTPDEAYEILKILTKKDK
jgi:hypothetical protein